MQIGQLNNLIFPEFGGSTAGAATPREARVRETPTAIPDTSSTIATIQSSSDAPSPAALPDDLVYSNTRNSVVDSATPDAASAEEQHRQALARSASAPSSLSVGKDGVLVAKPLQQDSDSQAFMTFAVNTMRQYADEQERQKALAKDSDSATHLIPRSMGDVQKLAARFKLFA